MKPVRSSGLSSSQPSPFLLIRVESLAGPVPVESFLRAAREIAFVATNLGPNGCGAASWTIVEALVQSPGDTAADGDAVVRHHNLSIKLAAPSGKEEVPERLRQGVRDILQGCEERPAGFSDNDLRSLRRVAQSAGAKIRVTLSAGQGQGEALRLDEELVKRIDGWLNGQSASMGTVEGRLELISIHDRPRFTLYGRDNFRVECWFPESMLTDVKLALGERVCLRGRIRYRRDGKPATVEAAFLQLMKAASPLPSRVNA